MKKILSFLLVLTLALSICITAYASPGYWMNDDQGWWYLKEDGSYAIGSWELIDNSWYHFDNSGYMQTGWLYDGGAWYFLSGSGDMFTGWLLLGEYWYYFLENGIMVTGERAIDGKVNYFDSDGHWIGEETNYYSGSVYVTKTGEKYHRLTCPTIQRSSNLTELSIEEAISYGYEACLVMVI